MIVAAHQPNFAPWLGFFDRMRKADLFVIVDHVQFERQNFQNRTRVKTGEGPRWLTVPVIQRSREERILDKLVDNSRDGKFRWGRKSLLTLRYSYQSAPHFKEAFPVFEEIFESHWDHLVDLNLALIEACRRLLGVTTPVLRSSALGIEGLKSEMVLNLCRAVGAGTYLSGTGGSKGYLDLAAFSAANVAVRWQEFEHPRYRQWPGDGTFAPGMSALDLIFNCGPEAGAVLKGEAGAVYESAR
jgi:hypothetical protein